MATTAKLANSVEEIVKVNGNSQENGVQQYDEFNNEWGFSLVETYKLALRFYRDKEGKAIQLSYKDKIRLVALVKQVAYGKYRPDVSPSVGFLDVVGNDRRLAWQTLEDMDKDTAMKEFITLLNNSCQLFKPFMEAQKAEKDDRANRKREEEVAKREIEEAAERERQLLEDEARRQQEVERVKCCQQEQHIRAVLNQQTFPQFSQYTIQQHPNDPQQQQNLLIQLQEQHYQQYMQQVYKQQLHQQQQFRQLNQIASTPGKIINVDQIQMNEKILNDNEQTNDEDENNDDDKSSSIAAPSMWSRKDIKEFKKNLQSDKDTILKVGSGETVTIRVPTNENGNCLFWEFATDYYDIAFGVSFEWTITNEETIRVEINESSDEEDDVIEDGQTISEKNDIEGGTRKRKNEGPPQDEIIPVYRRDCHEEVYCGSHMYPGKGVYLLKFDNSYSLWRGKTVYYRVYYTN